MYYRQDNCKHTSLAYFAFYTYRSSMRTGNLSGEAQSQPEPFGVVNIASGQAMELPENRSLVAKGDAGAVIGYRQKDMLPLIQGGDGDSGSFTSVEQRIVEQVAHGRTQVTLVSHQPASACLWPEV